MPFFERASDIHAPNSAFNEVAGNQSNTSHQHWASSANSNNRSKTTTTNSHNDSSKNQIVNGGTRDVSMNSYCAKRDILNDQDNYYGDYNVGDSYFGPIRNSGVGGRGNHYVINNGVKVDDTDTKLWNEKVRQAKEEEVKLEAQLREIRAQLAAKRAEKRVSQLTAELAAAKAELAQVNRTSPAPEPSTVAS